MGWSISYNLPVKEPKLLDEFFLAVGKALYLASNFESKCQFVLRIAKLANHYEQNEDTSATIELARVLKDKLLGSTINELRALPETTTDEISMLERPPGIIIYEKRGVGKCTAGALCATDQSEL